MTNISVPWPPTTQKRDLSFNSKINMKNKQIGLTNQNKKERAKNSTRNRTPDTKCTKSAISAKKKSFFGGLDNSNQENNNISLPI
jgi:hypothetical protein